MRHFAIALLAFTLSSCFFGVPHSSYKEDDFGSKRLSTTIKTFQRIAGYTALAKDKEGNTLCIVADFEEYYDGLTLKGIFYKKGTLSYTNTLGIERTVLVYLYGPDRKKLEQYVEEFLKSDNTYLVDDTMINHIKI